MPRPVFVFFTILVVIGCFTASAIAQPASAEVAPQSPEVVPPAVSPSVPAPAVAPPSVAPSAPALAAAAPPSSAPSQPMAWTLGPPSNLDTPAPAQAPRPVDAGRPLSESVALQLSLGSTIATWGLFIGAAQSDGEQLALVGLLGTLLAPSTGHWYRGSFMTRGFAARLIAGTAGTVSLFALTGSEGSLQRAEQVFFASLLLYVAGTLDDIIRAPLEVRKHNQRIEVLGIAPMVSDRSAGVALSGRF